MKEGKMQVVAGLLAVFALAAMTFVGGLETGPTVVSDIDVDRYMGLWYAVASIPTTFEQACAQGTTAEYRLLPNGRIDVVNTCYQADGEPFQAVGRAWIPDKQQPTKLKVSFVRFLGLWLFAGDYWILELDSEYRYAVVGHPKQRYGWVLSRTPQLAEEVLTGIFERLTSNGYDPASFKLIDQSIHLPSGSGP
jgi:apolipoprotein D and lipocalin family protein